MAIVQYTAIVNEIKGKLKGSVFSGGQAGPIIRSNRNHNVPGSSRWSLIKQRMATISDRWRNLSQAERDAWDAAAPNFPFTDKFGQSFTGSGFMVYTSLNETVLLLGEPLLTSPPMPVSITDVSPVTLGQNGATGNLEVTWSTGMAAGEHMLMFLSDPQSQGLAFRPGRLKLIQTQEASPVQVADVNDSYLAEYGYRPSGSRIWLKAVVANESTGQQGVPIVTDHIVI